MAVKKKAATGNPKLGDRVRFPVNGFEGIVVSVIDHLYQCRQVYIEPEKLDKEGQPQKGQWVDAPWVEVIKAGVYAPKGAVEETGTIVSGGPNRPHPPRRGDG